MSGWKCPGVKQSIEETDKFIKTSRRADKNAVAYRKLKQLDSNITALMSDPDNDKSSLLTYRRKVRQLLRKVSA